jgi:hypothetical protein
MKMLIQINFLLKFLVFLTVFLTGKFQEKLKNSTLTFKQRGYFTPKN